MERKTDVLPTWIRELGTGLVNGMSKEGADVWRQKFLDNVRECKDLEMVKRMFLAIVLESNLAGIRDECHVTKSSVKTIIDLLKSGCPVSDFMNIRERWSSTWAVTQAMWAITDNGEYWWAVRDAVRSDVLSRKMDAGVMARPVASIDEIDDKEERYEYFAYELLSLLVKYS